MAGICGVIALADSVDATALNRTLCSRLRHRGPDGQQDWPGEGAALSHLALHAEREGNRVTQPLRLSDGRIFVVDGFVGDPPSLMRALSGPSPSPFPADAQLIAMAFQRWGEDFWRHVEGDFAIAVWNPIARQLLLMRDRLGVRPLFHVRTRDLVAFCSEPEPLYQLPGVDGRVRSASVAEVWSCQEFSRPDWTSDLGVPSVLPPAHIVKVDAGGTMALSRYWRLEPRPELKLADEDEYVQAFREVFGRAFARSTRDVGTSALMLSGGIDSAAILAAGRGFQQGRSAEGLLCISAIADKTIEHDGFRRETENILALTAPESGAIQFHVPVLSSPGEVLTAADAAEVAWSLLHPVDASLYIPSLVCLLARRQGCRVVMGGIDGDLVADAPLRYVGRMALQGSWRTALREARLAARHHTYLWGRSPLHILSTGLLAELQPNAVRKLRAKRGLRADWRALRASELSTRFIEQHSIEATFKKGMVTQLARFDLEREDLRCRSMSEGIAKSLWGFNRVASRQGVEARYPWLDMSVVDFFLSLPMEWRVRGGWTKYLVRRSCDAALGADVAWHSGKSHLGSLLTRQLVIDAAPYLRQFLRGHRSLLAGILRTTFLDVVDRQLADPAGIDYPQANRINALAALAGWLQTQGAQSHGSAR